MLWWLKSFSFFLFSLWFFCSLFSPRICSSSSSSFFVVWRNAYILLSSFCLCGSAGKDVKLESSLHHFISFAFLGWLMKLSSPLSFLSLETILGAFLEASLFWESLRLFGSWKAIFGFFFFNPYFYMLQLNHVPNIIWPYFYMLLLPVLVILVLYFYWGLLTGIRLVYSLAGTSLYRF